MPDQRNFKFEMHQRVEAIKPSFLSGSFGKVIDRNRDAEDEANYYMIDFDGIGVYGQNENLLKAMPKSKRKLLMIAIIVSTVIIGTFFAPKLAHKFGIIVDPWERAWEKERLK